MIKKKYGVKKGLFNKNPDMTAFRKMAFSVLKKEPDQRQLLKNIDEYYTLWTIYCKAYKVDFEELKRNDILKREAAKRLTKLKDNHKVKSKNRLDGFQNYLVIEGEDIQQEKVETKAIDKAKELETNRNLPKNITQNKTLDQIIKDDELMSFERTTTKKTIKRRAISEISFASDITLSTVKRIEEFANFKQEISRDYLYFLNGGTDKYEKMLDGLKRKRHSNLLNHLKLSAKLQKKIQKSIDEILSKIDNDLFSVRDRTKMENELKLFESMLKTSREIDLQPIKFINEIEDGEFAAQKALQGAIVNDRTLIENGNIVLEKKKQDTQTTKESLDTDLRKLGDILSGSHIASLENKDMKEAN